MHMTFYFILVAALVLCAAFVWLAGKRSSLRRELDRRVQKINERGAEFEGRLQLLEKHVIDYLLSVGADGTRELAEMNASLAKLEVLIEEVKKILVNTDFHALHNAFQLLDYDYSELKKKNPDFDTEALPAHHWEENFEAMLQSLGERVEEASVQARAINLQKRGRERKATIDNLAHIGIRSAIEYIRAQKESESQGHLPVIGK